MIKHRGFTLIEVLIALSLSAVIMMGLMQLNQGLLKWLEFVRVSNNTQQTIALVFNQVECDLTAAYIPDLAKLEKTAEDKDKKEPESGVAAEKKKEQEEAFLKTCFQVIVDENAESKKIDDLRRYPVKYISFITTNALSVYGQKREQLVRVVYSIEKEKGSKFEGKSLFSLYRKETHKLENTTAKIDQFESVEKNDVTQYLIASHIVGMYADCSVLPKDFQRWKQKKASKESKDQPAKEIDDPTHALHFASWSMKKEISGFVPRTITLWIDLLTKHDKVERFAFTCHIYTYGDFLYKTQHLAQEKQELKEKDAQQEKQRADNQQSQEGPAAPAASAQYQDESTTEGFE